MPGVIQEKDILRCADGRVSFRYRDAKTGLSFVGICAELGATLSTDRKSVV